MRYAAIGALVGVVVTIVAFVRALDRGTYIRVSEVAQHPPNEWRDLEECDSV